MPRYLVPVFVEIDAESAVSAREDVLHAVRADGWDNASTEAGWHGATVGALGDIEDRGDVES